MKSDLNFLKMLTSGMSDAKCIWVSDFNEDSAPRFYEKFLELEEDPSVYVIPIFINSYGGSVYCLTAMRDLIKGSPKPVATICVGMAMSCGASLLAAGTKGFRFAAPDADILIHQVSGMSWGKTADIEEAGREYRRSNEKVFANLAADTGQSKDFFEQKIRSKNNADWTMTPKEAKKIGLIDHITIPRLTPEKSLAMLERVDSYDQKLAVFESNNAKPLKKKKKTKATRRS
jgi:ATP-dependent Clp protease, protease subunit